MRIEKETVGGLLNGHRAVGTARVKLTDQQFTALKGCLLRCPGPSDPVPNVAPVWIGGPGVSADSSEAGGMALLPGDAMFLPTDRLDSIYVISTAAAQDVAWVAI